MLFRSVLGYVFVFSDETEAPKDVHTVEYVLEIGRLKKEFFNDKITLNSAVIAKETNTELGFVCKEPDIKNSYDTGLDPNGNDGRGKEVYDDRDDLFDVYVTVRCEMEKNDWGYGNSGVSMPIGSQTKLLIGNMAVTATTINMEVID